MERVCCCDGIIEDQANLCARSFSFARSIWNFQCSRSKDRLLFVLLLGIAKSLKEIYFLFNPAFQQIENVNERVVLNMPRFRKNRVVFYSFYKQ